MTAADLHASQPATPAYKGIDLASHRPLTPQQAATPGVTPISKAIALLQHRGSATPSATPGRTARTAELSARKAELATLLNQVLTVLCLVTCCAFQYSNLKIKSLHCCRGSCTSSVSRNVVFSLCPVLLAIYTRFCHCSF